LHEQDNQKIIRSSGTDKLLVEEKGHNIYKRIDEKECAAAREYWETNKNYWGRVRKIWAEYISTHNSISLKNKIDEKFLHEYLINLGKDVLAKKVTDAEIDNRIKAEITKFITKDEKVLAGTN